MAHFRTPFHWGLVDGTDLTMFALGGTAFQGFSPLGGAVGTVTYFGPWPGVFSGGSFDTVLTLTPLAAPLPGALPLFATGLGALGLLGWRRKRKRHCSPRPAYKFQINSLET